MLLTDLKMGDTAVVTEINGGEGVRRKLNALGIGVGKKITKLNAMLMRGPITLRVGRTEIGIGHGVASKIVVDNKNKD